jgi:hypothetical protein
MTSDQVYKMIEDNGLTLHGDIEHFAELIASAEREECAKVADCYSMHNQDAPADIAKTSEQGGKHSQIT